MSSLVERLLDHAGDLTVQYARAVPKDLLSEAANEIERLREALEIARPYVANAVTSAARENNALATIDEALSLHKGEPDHD